MKVKATEFVEDGMRLGEREGADDARVAAYDSVSDYPLSSPLSCETYEGRSCAPQATASTQHSLPGSRPTALVENELCYSMRPPGVSRAPPCRAMAIPGRELKPGWRLFRKKARLEGEAAGTPEEKTGFEKKGWKRSVPGAGQKAGE